MEETKNLDVKPLSVAQHHQKLIDLATKVVRNARCTVTTDPDKGPCLEVDSDLVNHLHLYLAKECPRPIETPRNLVLTELVQVKPTHIIIEGRQLAPGEWVAVAKEEGKMMPATFVKIETTHWQEAFSEVRKRLDTCL